MSKPKLLVVAGPTASGKTGLGVRLAKRFDGEVVSADSMQIYKGMDIATAKPTPEEMQDVPHHLIGVLDPAGDSCSAADYAKLAKKIISDIHSRGKLPILVGGTGLYIAAVVDGTGFEGIPYAPEIRERLRVWGDSVSPEVLHARLKAVDPVLGESLHPNDRSRILRALEVYEASAVPLSEWQKRERESRGDRPYDYFMLGLDFPERKTLYDRIDRRVDSMLEQGLVAEARAVREYYTKTAVQAIGYKELEPFFQGTETLDACIDKLKQSTRRYAKRQLTWFRRREEIQWFYPESGGDERNPYAKAEMAVHKWLNVCYNSSGNA